MLNSFFPYKDLSGSVCLVARPGGARKSDRGGRLVHGYGRRVKAMGDDFATTYVSRW